MPSNSPRSFDRALRSGIPPIALAVLLLSAPPALAAPRTHDVVIDKMRFGPLPKDLRAGDRIRWVNRDMFRHTATAGDGSFNVDLMPGASATIIVRKAGAVALTCRYHPGMRAMLKVAK